MTKLTTKSLTAGRVVCIGMAALVATFILVFNHTHTPYINAQEPQATPSPSAAPPLGDCFSGALRDDPLHCYVLEQAQRDGTIDIEAMYIADGAGGTRALHIYLTQTEPVGNAIGQAFKQKATAFMDQWPELAFLDHSAHKSCLSQSQQNTDAKCLLEINTPWSVGVLFPVSRAVEQILVHSGGAEARKSRGGWSSYRQVWPSAARSSAPRSSTIDVSEVDTTTIPKVECVSTLNSDFGEGCGRSNIFKWVGLTRTELAGWVSGRDSADNDIGYVQVKAPGRDEEKLRVAREDIGTMLPNLIDDVDSTGRLVVIPVEHSYDDYWRWTILLDRFTRTSGNTMGITSAQLSGNYLVGLRESDATLRGGISEAQIHEPEGYRTTIRLWTLNSRATLDNLPRLLTALGIPDDAVGVVVQQRYSSYTPALLLASDTTESAVMGIGHDASISEQLRVFDQREQETQWYIIGGSVLAIGILASASVIVWRIRRRRNSLGHTRLK